MKHDLTNIIDLDSLPEHARTELLDFYEFLNSKYGAWKKEAETEGSKSPFKKFAESPIRVGKLIKYSREELHERR